MGGQKCRKSRGFSQILQVPGVVSGTKFQVFQAPWVKSPTLQDAQDVSGVSRLKNLQRFATWKNGPKKVRMYSGFWRVK